MQVNSKKTANHLKSPKQTLIEAGIEVCDVDITVRVSSAYRVIMRAQTARRLEIAYVYLYGETLGRK